MAGIPILDKPMTIRDCLSGQGFTFRAGFDDSVEPDENSDSDVENATQLTTDLNNINLDDEDLYEYNQVPFADIAKLMDAVDVEGMVKKRIFRNGTGDLISRNSKVTYHYKAYQEFEACAFDSTYARKRPEVSNLDNVLYGLSIAMTSMRLREKAQFLIKPEWAYGLQGIPPSIPPQATILFEIELLKCIPVTDNESDDIEQELLDSKDYTKNYNKALKLCSEGNQLIRDKKIKPAIRSYNIAIRMLSSVVLDNEDQEKSYVTLLVRLNSNLAIAHNKLEHWGKCCLACQEVYQLCNRFYRTVDDKVYYNHAKALYGLEDYARADEKLRKAAINSSYNRPNSDIMNLYRKIQDAKAKEAEATKNLAQAMFKKDANSKN